METAPFHVPHNLCIDRIDKIQLDNTLDDTQNLIVSYCINKVFFLSIYI